MAKLDLDDKSRRSAPGDSGVRGNEIYAKIRDDILSGKLRAHERLKVRDLAARYDVSTNPIREALQQLRGEGLVIIEPNRGAQVRAIDEKFLRNISEIQALLEPYMTRWFVGVATDADIHRLEEIQNEIEELNFSDVARNRHLDLEFHRVIYDRHYNRDAYQSWNSHIELLSIVFQNFPVAIARRAAVIREHRAIIQGIKRQDADGVAAVVATHVKGSCLHMIEQIRSTI